MRKFLARPVLMPMGAEFVKGIAQPVVIYAVREGPSPAGPSAGCLRAGAFVSTFREFSKRENVALVLFVRTDP